jgi:hypothetical protein
MKKRGQSQIITIILIILLVSVAVVIVWNVVKNTIAKSSEQVDMGILTVGLEIKSGTVYINQTSKELQFNLKRGPDNINISIFKVILICEDKSQENYL